MVKISTISGSTEQEKKQFKGIAEQLKNSPVIDSELMYNLGLYMPRQALSRLLFMQELYQKILDVHGVIMEFGVRWGQNLALFQNLRGIYEPFNYNRKIIGFDSFSGFSEVHAKDGNKVKKGDYGVANDYEKYLEGVLDYHESQSPIPHKKKYELVKGDATITVQDYLKRHPETIVALAYFDFDIYLPTVEALQQIKGHLTKGSVIAFDELNCAEFPGETLALKEIFGLDRYAIKRSPLNPLIAYIVID